MAKVKLTLRPLQADSVSLFSASELEKHLEELADVRQTLRKDVGAVELSSSSDQSVDSYEINVSGGKGYIRASNPRTLLVAVYAYLEGMGFAFPAPGVTVYPERIAGTDAHLEKRSAYLHRGVVIEGANSLDNVLDMIDWLPKVGMNSYFLQFRIPHTFFAKWHNHEGNPLLGREEFTIGQAEAFAQAVECGTCKRGLLLHRGGHGWTGDAMGLDCLGWDEVEEKGLYKAVPALVGGRRGLWHGVPLNTNICYSDQKSIDLFADAVVSYASCHRAVSVLHVWLADGFNNFCECPSCASTTPSDQYVRLLNLIDKKLEAKGFDTRICFLVYYDLLWPPVEEKLENPSRFILMFAPITRTFESSYAARSALPPIPPYVHNRIKPPVSLEENLAFLRAWKERVDTDSFDFDYHLGRAHYGDPGYEKISRVVFEDIHALEDLGLNGLMSCQEQRAAFPTALPDYLMGKTPWAMDENFDSLSDGYYSKAFGERGQALRRVLREVSMLFDTDFWNGKEPRVRPLLAERIAKGLPPLIEELEAIAPSESLLRGQGKMWKRISFLPEYLRLFGACFAVKAEGKDTGAAFGELQGFLRENELELQDALDVFRLTKLAVDYAGF